MGENRTRAELLGARHHVDDSLVGPERGGEVGREIAAIAARCSKNPFRLFRIGIVERERPVALLELSLLEADGILVKSVKKRYCSIESVARGRGTGAGTAVEDIELQRVHVILVLPNFFEQKSLVAAICNPL